jgi:hypothetical protein
MECSLLAVIEAIHTIGALLRLLVMVDFIAYGLMDGCSFLSRRRQHDRRIKV